MASTLSLLNRLLPFATPGTPFLQDLLHLAILCALLYFAPQIQQRLRAENVPAHVGVNTSEAAQAEPVARIPEDPPADGDEAPLRARDVLDHNGPQRDIHMNDDRLNAEPVADWENAGELNANAHQAVEEAPRQRNVGAKKAKSLARKDQRRAYHEFMRSQGDAQRARDAEGAEARQAALSAEKERRRLAESHIESQKAAERDAKRSREETLRQENLHRIEFVLDAVRTALDTHRACDLFRLARMIADDVDEEWIEQVLKTSGILGRKGDTMTMITETGWAVRITADDMMNVYNSAMLDKSNDVDGRVTTEKIADLLGMLLKTKADAAIT